MNGTEQLELTALQLYAQHTLPRGVHVLSTDRQRDLVWGDMVESIRALVYGKEGARTTTERNVIEARFPKWLPKFLRTRWSKEMTLGIDVTPRIVFPEMAVVPENLGIPVRIVTFNREWWREAAA